MSEHTEAPEHTTVTMAGIKAALNHRSLTQHEQWWLVARMEAAEAVCRSLALDRIEALVCLIASQRTEEQLERWINDHE